MFTHLFLKKLAKSLIHIICTVYERVNLPLFFKKKSAQRLAITARVRWPWHRKMAAKQRSTPKKLVDPINIGTGLRYLRAQSHSFDVAAFLKHEDGIPRVNIRRKCIEFNVVCVDRCFGRASASSGHTLHTDDIRAFIYFGMGYRSLEWGPNLNAVSGQLRHIGKPKNKGRLGLCTGSILMWKPGANATEDNLPLGPHVPERLLKVECFPKTYDTHSSNDTPPPNTAFFKRWRFPTASNFHTQAPVDRWIITTVMLCGNRVYNQPNLRYQGASNFPVTCILPALPDEMWLIVLSFLQLGPIVDARWCELTAFEDTRSRELCNNGSLA